MTKRSKRKKKLVLFSVLLSFSALTIFYISQIIKVYEIGYLIGKNTDIVNSLQEENAELKLAVSQKSNLKNAEEKLIEKGFQKISASTINYIIVSDMSLAKK